MTNPIHRLTFYFIPSPYGINWDSPKTLSLSVLKNRINFARGSRHPIGHVNIELTTETVKDGVTQGMRHFVTGMVATETKSQLKLVLLKHLGLGVLFHSFGGRLETADEILPRIPLRRPRGDLSSVSFQISESMRDRLIQYMRDFRERKFDHSYGLKNRPLYGEGSGCSAFAASFLKIIGIATPSYPEFKESWSRLLRIPQRLIGDLNTGKKVYYPTLMFGRSSWAEASEPHQSILFWDPDLMHEWALKFAEGQQSANLKKRIVSVGKIEETVHIELDFNDHDHPEKTEWHHYDTD